MKDTNIKQLLRNPDIEPTCDVIAEALGNTNDSYMKFIDRLKNHEIELGWRYYTDGNSWLGKGTHTLIGSRGGKKEVTAFWLSIWEDLFKVTIYVPEKARFDLLNIPFSDEIRTMIEEAKQIGKLKFFPLVFDLQSDELFDEIYKIIDFRKALK